jgi:hypothetical protein
MAKVAEASNSNRMGKCRLNIYFNSILNLEVNQFPNVCIQNPEELNTSPDKIHGHAMELLHVEDRCKPDIRRAKVQLPDFKPFFIQ